MKWLSINTFGKFGAWRIKLGSYYWDTLDDGRECLVVSQTWLSKILGKNVVIFHDVRKDNKTDMQPFSKKGSDPKTKLSEAKG